MYILCIAIASYTKIGEHTNMVIIKENLCSYSIAMYVYCTHDIVTKKCTKVVAMYTLVMLLTINC